MVFREHVPRCSWCSYTLHFWDLGLRKYEGLISWKLFVAGVWPSTLCVICHGSLLSNSCDPAFIKSRPKQCCLNRKLLPRNSYNLMGTVTLAEGSKLQCGLFRCVDGSWEYHESEETSRGTRLLFWAFLPSAFPTQAHNVYRWYKRISQNGPPWTSKSCNPFKKCIFVWL